MITIFNPVFMEKLKCSSYNCRGLSEKLLNFQECLWLAVATRESDATRQRDRDSRTGGEGGFIFAKWV